MTGIDWQRAHERLERSRRSLEQGSELSPAAAARILEARAQLLARPLPAPADSDDALELLVFSLVGATYAVDAEYVVEAVALAAPTPLPWVPSAVVGVVNHRGRIVPVVDLARLLAPVAGEAGEHGLAVVVVAEEASFALRADSVSGVVRFEKRDVLPTAELADQPDPVVSGLTAAMVAVLDIEALARDPRVVVNDEFE